MISKLVSLALLLAVGDGASTLPLLRRRMNAEEGTSWVDRNINLDRDQLAIFCVILALFFIILTTIIVFGCYILAGTRIDDKTGEGTAGKIIEKEPQDEDSEELSRPDKPVRIISVPRIVLDDDDVSWEASHSTSVENYLKEAKVAAGALGGADHHSGESTASSTDMDPSEAVTLYTTEVDSEAGPLAGPLGGAPTNVIDPYRHRTDELSCSDSDDDSEAVTLCNSEFENLT